VTARPSLLGASLALLTVVVACTNDFSGYHLGDTGGAGGHSASGGQGEGGLAAESGGESGSDGSAPPGAGAPSSAQAGSSGGRTGSTAGGSAVVVEPGGAGAGGAGATGAETTGPPSCDGLKATCGADQTADCCQSSPLPAGTYNRSNMTGATATVSAFSLDDYEISVGRLRKFVAVFSPTMTAAGAGKNPSNLAQDPGWDVAWNAKLPADGVAFSKALQCTNGTFTAAPGANEDLPATCLNWYEAFAFCVWDGGRLPTEAEWNYAAAGGDEERPHPWGTAAADNTNAVFCPGSCGKVQAVGSRAPAGNGKWGQADLVGNAWEWNLDVFANPYAQTDCVDCAYLKLTSSSQRAFRGGSAGNDASYLLASTRSSRDPSDHNAFVGARCARNP